MLIQLTFISLNIESALPSFVRPTEQGIKYPRPRGIEIHPEVGQKNN
jgi:hypothetical protein